MKNKKVAVLDITSDRITLVMQDKYADNFTFRSSQSYDGYYNGEFLCDPSELFKIIESLVTECEKATFTKLTDIMVGVPGEFTAVSCKSVSNTLGMERKVTARDVDVLYEIGKPESDTHVCISASPIYFELEDGTCTITPVGGVTNVLKCLMSYVVCERSFTALFDKISEEIGVKFTYASSLLAEVMYVVPESLRDYGVVLADVGFTSTSVAYARGDGIAHALSFSLGGGHVIGDLYEVKEMPFNHATALLDRINLNIAATAQDEYSVSFGSEIAYYNVNEINEVAIDRIENIADMIGQAPSQDSRNLDFFAHPVFRKLATANVGTVFAQPCHHSGIKGFHTVKPFVLIQHFTGRTAKSGIVSIYTFQFHDQRCFSGVQIQDLLELGDRLIRLAKKIVLQVFCCQVFNNTLFPSNPLQLRIMDDRKISILQ